MRYFDAFVFALLQLGLVLWTLSLFAVPILLAVGLWQWVTT